VSVLTSIVIESRRYSGWIDPRYPIGYWQASLSATGDATGGVLAIDLVFQGALAGSLNSQMYSVERFTVRSNNGADRDVELKAVNMGGPANQGFVHAYTLALAGVSGPGTSAPLTTAMAIIPWFLGSQRTAGITASLSMVVDNLNAVVFDFEAEGYRWSARSVLVDGGPQRPPTGPYRT